MPHARRRGGQGRPRPHRHGRAPEERAARSTSSTRAGASRGTSSSTPSPPPTAASSTACSPRETKTSVELLDAEGKKQTILREDIDELAASKKSLMPEGFEKQVPPEEMADLLAVPRRRRGKYLPLDLRKVGDGRQHARGCSSSRTRPLERLVFPDWSPKIVRGRAVPARRPAGRPRAERGHAPRAAGRRSRRRCRSRSACPCNAPAKAIHLLSGVSGWGFHGRAATGPSR